MADTRSLRATFRLVTFLREAVDCDICQRLLSLGRRFGGDFLRIGGISLVIFLNGDIWILEKSFNPIRLVSIMGEFGGDLPGDIRPRRPL